MQVLTKQTLYAVATRLEVILGAEQDRVKLDPAENILFAWAGPLTENQDQSYCRAFYSFYVKTRAQRPKDNGIMADKGIAHGLPLQTSAFGWASNFSTQAPPRYLLSCAPAPHVLLGGALVPWHPGPPRPLKSMH